MGDGQIWCSRADNGSAAHLRPQFEFQSSSPHSGLGRRSAGVGRPLDCPAALREGSADAYVALRRDYYLREALKAKVLRSELGAEELKRVLTTQYERWWNIKLTGLMSKQHFLGYAGRYIRHPPIAQHRFVKVTDREVQFWRKNLKQKRRVLTRYSLEEFVATLSEHVPDRYRHGMW